MACRHREPVAIIGAGFSGLAIALQLLNHGLPNPILLFERAARFGRGLAYDTANPCHWLNVPAQRLSLFEDQPGHFADWLQSCDPEDAGSVRTPLGMFASRGLYGRYLAETLLGAVTRMPGAARLILVNDEVTDIAPMAGQFQVTTAGGRTHCVASVVLALGHPRPSAVPGAVRFGDPWDPRAIDDLKPGRPVLVLGTGLTMVDLALGLDEAAADVPIIALSRRGMLPMQHAASKPWQTPGLNERERGTLSLLLRRVRREVAAAQDSGANWQAVIDGLRPITQDLWRGLPPDRQARFLRHLRPWWDAHRHRMAPAAAEVIRGMIARGRLIIERGTVLQIHEHAEGARVLWRPRTQAVQRATEVQRVIDATGLEREGAVHDPLRERMRSRGLIRPGAHGLGIDVTPGLAVIDAQGRAQPRMWALGPITRGAFWESTAVPDIRIQAGRLAQQVADAVRRAA